MELLKAVAPGVTRVAVLRDPLVPAGSGGFAAVQTAAASLRVELIPVGVHDANEIERGIPEAVADRGYYSGEEILACHQAGITVTLPKPITSGIEAKGRFGKQDFVYLSDEDVYRCPAGEKLSYHYTNEENGLVLRRYWTNACQSCGNREDSDSAEWQDWLVDDSPDQETTLAAKEEFDNRRNAVSRAWRAQRTRPAHF